MITDLNKKVKKITVDGITMELKPKVLGGEYNLESVLLEDGTQKIVATKAEVVTSGKYFVKVIDYDGTVLKEVNASTGDIITLPNAPSHEGLVFQEWSCSQEIIDGAITIADNNVMVGAVYGTESGLSEFDIELTKTTGLTVTFKMVGNKNWGDGTSNSETTHTYANYGNYTITCDGTSLPQYIMGQSSSYNYTLTNVRLGNIKEIPLYSFENCKSLISAIIPNTVTTFDPYIFANCYALENIIIPTSITIINYNDFAYCYNLTNVVIPQGVTNIGNQAFRECKFKSITIPDSVINFGSYIFTGCNNIENVTIPSGVNDINTYTFRSCQSLKKVIFIGSLNSIGGTEAFAYCYSITKYDFSNNTVVPTLSNTNAFSDINAICKIIVPDALYDEWITATNWTTYADYIYKVSEVTE